MEYEKLFETKKISSKQGLTKQLVSLVLNQGKKKKKIQPAKQETPGILEQAPRRTRWKRSENTLGGNWKRNLWSIVFVIVKKIWNLLKKKKLHLIQQKIICLDAVTIRRLILWFQNLLEPFSKTVLSIYSITGAALYCFTKSTNETSARLSNNHQIQSQRTTEGPDWV